MSSRGQRTARRLGVVLIAASAGGGAVLAGSGGTAGAAGGGLLGQTPAASSAPADIGTFSTPFAEPSIGRTRTAARCIKKHGVPANDPTYDGLIYDCKPAGVSVNVLTNGRVMYYDGLEGTENINTSMLFEYGHNSGNDQSRVLDLHGDPTGLRARFATPRHTDGGANGNGDPTSEKTLPAPLYSTEKYNDGALFCSDNTFLPDGRVLAMGGTDYYNEPNVKVGSGQYGVSELEGIKQSRIYDPKRNSWYQTGSMHFGRWYPTAIELANGNVFTASGVTKLVKPVYTSHPGDSLTNVEQTETYDTLKGRWTLDPDSANKSLPLFPRLSLLPDGKVFYNANGQAFNPFGQSYDEALWNLASVYDPNAQSWHDLGIPGVTDLAPGGLSLDVPSALKDAGSALKQGGIPGFGAKTTLGGFRGSTFSVMLPLTPGKNGAYNSASFLTAGGVLNPPSPGSYFTTSDSRITTVDTTGGRDVMSTRPTGDLNGPRWYPSGVLTPTGLVFAFNGADRDEVAGPGVEVAKRQAEMFDPSTQKWSPVAFSHDPRTYHNSATLLPDGRILVGGHAPISFLYLKNLTLPGGVTAPNDGRDPSFEIFSPPYLFWGARPKIASAPSRIAYARRIRVRVAGRASAIRQVVLVRNTSVSHLVDANQRNVVLPVVSRHGHTVTVKAPPSANVAPPGGYMLFVSRRSRKGLIPSKAAQAFVGIGRLEAMAHPKHS